MRFLTGADIQTEVRAIASRTGEVLAAVAYWGSGASDRTALTQHDRPVNVRVICDLLSGACNPAEIEVLRKLGVTVKTLDRLHAKVWIGGNDVIVGSANASRNGLPGDGEHGGQRRSSNSVAGSSSGPQAHCLVRRAVESIKRDRGSASRTGAAVVETAW